jgi:hypothetical protein
MLNPPSDPFNTVEEALDGVQEANRRLEQIGRHLAGTHHLALQPIVGYDFLTRLAQQEELLQQAYYFFAQPS